MRITSALHATWLTLGLSITAGAATDTMQAAVVGNGSTTLQTVAKPTPAAGEVRVRVRAAGVNPVDWKMAAGYKPQPPSGGDPKPPSAAAPSPAMLIPGFDAAGTIDALGAGVTGWKVGDPVIVFLEKLGAYAEYAVAPANAITRKPDALTFEQAAGIPTTACTAWAVLVDMAGITPGQRVLVHGGAGGVGSATVQIAKARGAYVIATASARNHDFLRSIGADETVDYNAVRFEDKVRDVDVAINTVDAATATRSVAVTRPGGMVLSVAGAPDAATCAAAKVRCAMRSRDGTPVGQVLREVAALAAAGKYSVNVDATYTLADVDKAWASGREGHTRGKLVIRMNE